MNINIKSIPSQLSGVLKKLNRYYVFIFMLVVLGMYGFLVFQIGQLSRAEPDEDLVTEQLKVTARPKIDQDSITKIQQLEDQSISVQSLFKAARDNPFQDE